MGTTLPGINQLPRFQSFGSNKENVASNEPVNFNSSPSNCYFEYKPVYMSKIPTSTTPVPLQTHENQPHSNYSYQHSPQFKYITTSNQTVPQYIAQPVGNRYTPSTVIYHQPLTSPLDIQGYVKSTRSGSSDSTSSSAVNLRLPSIQELVSPINSTSSPPAYHPIPQHQQAQQFYEQQQRVLQHPEPLQMQQPGILHPAHVHSHPHPHPVQIHQQIPLQPGSTGIAHHPAQNCSSSHTIHHISHIQPKKIRKRTRTGCLTCRKRRIKCDERKPSCLNCEKSKKCCAGYVDVTKKSKKPSNSTTKTTNQQTTITV